MPALRVRPLVQPAAVSPHEPDGTDPILARNYALVQRDSAAVGVVNAVSMFLPVLIVRLGGSGFDVSLLTVLPALAGFALAIPVGRFLQRKPNIVPWYSGARLLAQCAYALMAVATFLAPPSVAVVLLLAIWGLATLPSTAYNVAFSIVMDGAAGPRGRYELLGQRWAISGLATAVTAGLAGQLIERVGFPAGYEAILMLFTGAAFVSFHYSHRIVVTHRGDHHREAGLAPAAGDAATSPAAGDAATTSPAVGGAATMGPAAEVNAAVSSPGLLELLRGERPFLSFEARRFLFGSGIALATPLLPLYYVQVAHASDAWIGILGTVQAAALLVGYTGWRRLSRRRSSGFVLVCTTLVSALYPAALATTSVLPEIAAFLAASSLFTAGANLALFDHMMATIPPSHGVTFVAVDQSQQNLARTVAPLAGGALALWLGPGPALAVGSGLSLAGALLFTRSSLGTA